MTVLLSLSPSLVLREEEEKRDYARGNLGGHFSWTLIRGDLIAHFFSVARTICNFACGVRTRHDTTMRPQFTLVSGGELEDDRCVGNIKKIERGQARGIQSARDNVSPADY